jgi:hypothetical protein
MNVAFLLCSILSILGSCWETNDKVGARRSGHLNWTERSGKAIRV